MLLEEYHSKLSKPDDSILRNALEQVIDIFRSDLFHALIGIQFFCVEYYMLLKKVYNKCTILISKIVPDIQEYYELTLMESLKDFSGNSQSNQKLNWPKNHETVSLHCSRQTEYYTVEQVL